MTLFKDKFKIDSNRLKNWDYSSTAVYFITIVTRNRECLFGSVEDDKMILNENGQIIQNELLKSIKIRKNWFFHNWIVMPNHIHLLIEIQDNEFSIETNNFSIIERTQFERPHIVETHSGASTSGISATIDKHNINEQIEPSQFKRSHIVETHSSASTSGTSTTNITNDSVPIVAETHSSAPLQYQSGSILRDENNLVSKTINVSLKYEPNQSDSKLSRKTNSISSFVAIFKSVTTKQINGFESIWQQNYHDHVVRNYKRFETIYDYIKNNPRSWETDIINSKQQ